MISMPVRSPLCTVRSKVWPANAFWWTVPSGLRSKKQPSSFSSSLILSIGQDHELPGELLVGEPARRPAMVSMKWRSTESSRASATL